MYEYTYIHLSNIFYCLKHNRIFMICLDCYDITISMTIVLLYNYSLFLLFPYSKYPYLSGSNQYYMQFTIRMVKEINHQYVFRYILDGYIFHKTT